MLNLGFFDPGRDPKAVANELMKMIYDPALSQDHRILTTNYAPTIRVSNFTPIRICERNSNSEEATGNWDFGNLESSNDYPENSEGVWKKLMQPWFLTADLAFSHQANNGDNTRLSQESVPSEAPSSAAAATDEDVPAQAATLRLSLDLSDFIPHVARKLELLTDYDRDAFEIKNLATRDMLVAVRILPVSSSSGISLELPSTLWVHALNLWCP